MFRSLFSNACEFKYKGCTGKATVRTGGGHNVCLPCSKFDVGRTIVFGEAKLTEKHYEDDPTLLASGDPTGKGYVDQD